MEQGRGLHLAPHKYERGQDIIAKKKKRQRDDKNALEATNVQLNVLARCMRVSYFRSVFMRNALLTSGVQNESDIVNLDDATGSNTH